MSFECSSIQFRDKLANGVLCPLHFQLPPTKNLPDPAMAGAAEAELLRGSSRGRRRAAEARGAGDAGGAREGPRRRNHSLSRCCGWWEEGEGEARV